MYFHGFFSGSFERILFGFRSQKLVHLERGRIGRSERGVQIEDPLALERRIRRYHAGQRDEAGDRGVDDAGIGGSRPVRSRYGVGLAELVHFDYEGDELEQVTVVDKAPNCGQSYKKT